MLVMRMGLLDLELSCPVDLLEAVSTIIYCARRVDSVPEFVQVL
jgi:hypothetical protein